MKQWAVGDKVWYLWRKRFALPAVVVKRTAKRIMIKPEGRWYRFVQPPALRIRFDSPFEQMVWEAAHGQKLGPRYPLD